MNENKLTTKETIKALEFCSHCECNNEKTETECPLINMPFCKNYLRKQSLDLINRQQAEIERLREIRDLCNTTILEKNEQIEKLKISDASKEECTIRQHGEIKDLKAEIERLQEKYDRTMTSLKAVLDERADHTEAITEFVALLIANCNNWNEITAEKIEKLAEEFILTYKK